MLFVIGGNGTHAGAHAIHKECFKRKLKVAVVGVVSPPTVYLKLLGLPFSVALPCQPRCT
jgi:hypothetical protein